MTTLFNTAPLFAFARKGVLEVVIHGAAVVKTQGKPVQSEHEGLVLATRSLLKPWQFLAIDTYGPESFWAMGLASHSGQAPHMDALLHLKAVAEADENDLICPRVLPLDPVTAASMRLSGESLRRLHHPCAGKHLMMIAACRKHGLTTDNYWDLEHPLQKRVLGLVGREAGEKLTWVIDSCGVPNAAMSVKAHLAMWEKLATSDEQKSVDLRTLWLANPRLVGGQRRLDSDLVEASGGRLLVKEGADGLLIVQSLPDGAEKVASCLIKLASGYNSAHLALALWGLLSNTQGLPKVFDVLTDYLRSRLEEWIPRDQTFLTPPFA